MASNKAAIESYGGDDAVKFTTARGGTVKGRCLTFSQAIRCMALEQTMRDWAGEVEEAGRQLAAAEDRESRLAADRAYRAASAGMSLATQDLLQEFARYTGTGDAQVTGTEVIQEVLPYFLDVSGTRLRTTSSPTATSPTTALMS